MKNRGDILLSVLIFAAITVTITIGLVNWGAAMLAGIRTVQAREQAFQVAEAGVDYYRWHLAQLPSDYKDGTNTAGPYYHNFYDKDGNLLGTYKLVITAPPVGSTKVTITSTGTTTSNASVKRTIQATLGIPSLAQYSVVANDNLRFGAGTVIYGPVTANGGIRFDGIAYNIVSSAKTTYTDPDDSSNQWGVYTTSGTDDPHPNTPVNNRPDVFVAGRQFPVPAIDFAGLTLNLQQLLTLSMSGGICASPGCWVPSAAQGYYLHFNTNDTFDMYKVTALQSAPNNCTNDNSQTQWGTWSIKTLSAKIGTYAIPANGIVFVQDHIWIDGQINSARVTVAAGTFPDTPGSEPNITLGSSNSANGNNNLLYTNFDGTDTIGLIAQGNVNVALFSPDTLTIDAALVAENGRVGRFYYNSNCKSGGNNYYTRSTLNLLGMIATAVRYGFAYTDGTGYDVRNITYDANLLYGPPPSFPLASSQYQMVSWQEI